MKLSDFCQAAGIQADTWADAASQIQQLRQIEEASDVYRQKLDEERAAGREQGKEIDRLKKEILRYRYYTSNLLIRLGTACDLLGYPDPDKVGITTPDGEKIGPAKPG